MATPYNPSYPYQPFQPQGQAAYPPPVDYGTIDKQYQPAYNYQPQSGNATVVVAAQPVTATTTVVSPPEENHSGIAICALVFSLCTLFTSGALIICLSLFIPALFLAIVALSTRGRSQKGNAGISIGLNVAVVVLTVVLLVLPVLATALLTTLPPTPPTACPTTTPPEEAAPTTFLSTTTFMVVSAPSWCVGWDSVAP